MSKVAPGRLAGPILRFRPSKTLNQKDLLKIFSNWKKGCIANSSLEDMIQPNKLDKITYGS